jgi:hypothetical protein
MNLPILLPIDNENSTYITFQKANLDFDREVATSNGVYYFSHVVGLNLPTWTSVTSTVPRMYKPSTTHAGWASNMYDPNIIFPNVIRYYLENICRSNISNEGESLTEEVVELSFWKMLKYMGMTKEQIRSSVTFCNGIFANNFIETDTNNGWVEIICQVPNKCKQLIPAWRTISKVKTTVTGINDDQTPAFDSGATYNFNDMKDVLNFAQFEYNETDTNEFLFNVLLLFYTDSTGIPKLHGINFIYPYEAEPGGQEYLIEPLKHVTNKIKSVGYQFLFNVKSVNNQVNKTFYYNQNNELFYNNQFENVMGKFAQFFELVRPRIDYNFTIDIDKVFI